jgi:predicted MFS family arabinose efflux permease
MEARWPALAVLTIARASTGFQFQSVGSVSPMLLGELGLGYAEIGVLIGLYFLPGIALALPGGLLGRRFGDTHVVAAGLVLMLAGGVLSGLAWGYPVLVAGRLVSGTGAVLLNVAMSKMIADWFIGREIVLAMAVWVNSFPIGIGLALLCLGPLAEAAGWPAAFHATAALAAASLLLMALRYRPHPNDRLAATGPGRPGGAPAISLREVALVSVAGAIWGLYNGAFAIMFGFAPTLLTGTGYTVVGAGLMVGAASWLVVLSGQAGGLVAQRWGHPDALMLGGTGAWGVALLALPWTDPGPVLLLAGLVMGAPTGIVMALPAEALRPESRAVGMGIFYTWLYVGHAALPPVAGWLQDLTGSAAAPPSFAAALVLALALLFLAFRLAQRRAG